MKQPKFSFEPRKVYDLAIIDKLKDGRNIYSYKKLISLTTKHFYPKDRPSAEDWVQYNMLPLDDNGRNFRVRFEK